MGDREVLNKVADLPDTGAYKTEAGNYIDLATYHQEFNIAYILPLYIKKNPVWWVIAKKRGLITN